MPRIPAYMFLIHTSHQLEKKKTHYKADYILSLTALGRVIFKESFWEL